MKIIRNLEGWEDPALPVVLAVGFFDGVHRGHQAVLEKARQLADEGGSQAWVLTFEPHPLKVIRPDKAPLLLTSLEHKQRLLERLGLDGCLVLDFNPGLRRTPPQDFLALLTRHLPALRHLVVGINWTFGAGRQGSAANLGQLARQYHIAATVVAPVLWRDAPISSSRLRKAVAGGRLREAERMLGRPFSAWGEVVHGREVGRTLGFPTANVDPHNEVLPPDGIYAVELLARGTVYPGVAYLGDRPTFADPAAGRLVETHLFDTQIDLYGTRVEVFFHAFIRGDQRFDSAAALQEQIARDIQAARVRLRDRAAKKTSAIHFTSGDTLSIVPP